MLKSLLDFDIDIDNELNSVVFDEIHYINDADVENMGRKYPMLPSQSKWLCHSNN